MRYCAVVKADIPKCDNCVDAAWTRFHSDDNRIKGDRRRRSIATGGDFPGIWRPTRMLSRALSLATVTILAGCLSAGSAHAQNLEAGKSPSQIFAGACTACHKSPRGLLKTVPAGSLPGFLRQHYTTSSDMAGVLASYLISNGANDPRYQAKDRPKDARERGADGLSPNEGHPGRRGKRMARPSETPDGVSPAEGQGPDAAHEGKPQRHKLGRRGKPVEERPGDESNAAKGEGKGEAEKPASAKPASDSAKVDAPKESAGGEATPLRSDPVPPVTPATPATGAAPAPSGTPEAATSR
jgi:hypothetical protein